MGLKEQAERVHDQKSLLDFVRALIADREDEIAKEQVNPSNPCGPGANGWENTTVEDVLEAASRWAEDTDFGQSVGLPPENPWCQFAAFLYLGKIYE